MQLEKYYLYHNDKQRKIFFQKENYLYFLKKIKTHLTPHNNVITRHLTPNHFHLTLIKEEEKLLITESNTMPKNHCITTYDKKTRTINNSIAILLHLYTRTTNKQEKICFDYIHQNPVKTNMAKDKTDCEFSSARDYVGLINKEITFEYIKHSKENDKVIREASYH